MKRRMPQGRMEHSIAIELYEFQGYLREKSCPVRLGLKISIPDIYVAYGTDSPTWVDEQMVRDFINTLSMYRNGLLSSEAGAVLDTGLCKISIELPSCTLHYSEPTWFPNIPVADAMDGQSDSYLLESDAWIFDFEEPDGIEEQGNAVVIVPEVPTGSRIHFSCKLNDPQIDSILHQFQSTMSRVDWNTYGKQPLYHIRFPKKHSIAPKTITEMEHVLSELVLGHCIEKVLFSTECLGGMTLIDHFNHKNFDAWDILLVLDHGYLIMVPWSGYTFKILFYKKDEAVCTYGLSALDLDLVGFDSQYFEMPFVDAQDIYGGRIDSATSIQTMEYEARDLILQSEGNDLYREPTTILLALQTGTEVGILSSESEECWIQIRRAGQIINH